MGFALLIGSNRISCAHPARPSRPGERTIPSRAPRVPTRGPRFTSTEGRKSRLAHFSDSGHAFLGIVAKEAQHLYSQRGIERRLRRPHRVVQRALRVTDGKLAACPPSR
jgi:hypothetical protein